MEFNHPDEMKKEEAGTHRKGHSVKIDFSAFILSLSSSALVAIGAIPDPLTKEMKKDLGTAKHMIDVINMLKEKTKGNLSKDEDELIQSLCSELKMKYLDAVKFK